MRIACIWNPHNMFQRKKKNILFFGLELETLILIQNANEYCVTKRISVLIVVNKYFSIVWKLQRWHDKSKKTALHQVK